MIVQTSLWQVEVPENLPKQVPGAIGEKVMLNIAGEIAWSPFRFRFKAILFIYGTCPDQVV